MDKQRPTLDRATRRALEREEAKRREREGRQRTNQDAPNYSRRLALPAAGILLAGGVALAYFQPWNNSSNNDGEALATPTSIGLDLRGATPAEHVDKKLVKEIIDIEGNYRRQDLLDKSLRQQHLSLCAEAFSRYSGENQTRNELTGSMNWVSDAQFAAKFPTARNAAAALDVVTGGVYIREQSLNLTNPAVVPMRRFFPWWSALSAARLEYEHEWMHRPGVTVRKDLDTPFSISKHFDPSELGSSDADFWWEYSLGFGIYGTDKPSNFYFQDINLEEAYAYYMVAQYNKELLGLTIQVERLEAIQGSQGIATNTGIRNFGILFNRKPDWIKNCKDFHRQADPLNFAHFLADNSARNFGNAEDKKDYAVALLTSITSARRPQVFNNFIASLT